LLLTRNRMSTGSGGDGMPDTLVPHAAREARAQQDAEKGNAEAPQRFNEGRQRPPAQRTEEQRTEGCWYSIRAAERGSTMLFPPRNEGVRRRQVDIVPQRQ